MGVGLRSGRLPASSCGSSRANLPAPAPALRFVTKVKIKVKIKINGARKNKGAQNGIVLRLEGRRIFTQA
jgi:hypothetical protein